MSKARKKGTAAESAVLTYLQEQGFPEAYRMVLSGALDKGDIGGLRDVTIEVKNHAAMDLAGWLDEAQREAENAETAFGVVWHKRRGKGHPADWYVTMTGKEFMMMLRAISILRSF